MVYLQIRMQTRTQSEQNTIPNTPIRFLMYVSKPHRWWALGAIVFATLAQLFMSLNPYVIKKMVDAFSSPAVERTEQLELFAFWGVMAVALLVAGFASWRLSGFIGLEWLTRVNATGYRMLYGYISGHSHSYFSDHFAGALSNKVSNASDGVGRLLERSLWGWYPEVITMVVGVALLFSVDGYIALGFLVTFVVMFGVNLARVRHRRPHVVAYAAATSKLRGDGVDYLTNVSTTRQYVRGAFELARISASADERRQKDVRQWRMSEWSLTMNNAASAALVAGVLLYTYVLLRNGVATPGDVILVLLVLTRMTHIIIFLGNAMNGFIREYGEIEEGLNAVLVPHEVTDVLDAKQLVLQVGSISWSGVRFRYEDNEVFEDFNLAIEPKQRIGLVGPSGAGKSTLVSLLLRQHDLTDGSISIDGQDIAQVTQSSLREAIAVVPQESNLFHRSIRENIAYGKPDATQEEVEEAARMAQAHDFISALPQGYDTLVGERGVKLSGGQRQRVAIARAMLKNSPILMLDEATSSLDSESEAAIQKALHILMEGKTVIAIAHRLSTLREMDRIIVLDGGRIVEDGTHHGLVAKGGLYASLWAHQAGGFLQE